MASFNSTACSPPNKIDPSKLLASTANPLLLVLLFSVAATFISSCQFCLHSFILFLLLWQWLYTLYRLKASLNLQIKDWDVRITSTGLGVFPLWRTNFLWVQIVHRVVKIDWRELHFVWIGMLAAVIWLRSHCFTERWFGSEVLMPSDEPHQTALTKGHCRNRWDNVSSPSSHIGHLLAVWMPLLIKFVNTSRLSCNSFQIKVVIFIGSFIFHKAFQTNWGISSVLWSDLVFILWICWIKE